MTEGVPHARRDWRLWRIRQNGADIYLFAGTTPTHVDFASERTQAALAASDILWTETVHQTREPMETLIKRYGVAPGRSLTALLTPEDRARLERVARIAKIPLASMEPYRPWLAAASLPDAFCLAVGRTGSTANGVLTAQAEAAGKLIYGEFPTRDDVFTWFGAMPPATELAYLRYTLDELESQSNEAIATAWAMGDMDPAARWVARMKKVYPSLYEAVVLERNQNWVPRISSLIAENKKAFVMVGMFHMVGPDSVLRLLNPRYSVHEA